MNNRQPSVLKANALRIHQRSDVPLFVFGINGRLIHRFASVHFAHRVQDGALAGYQRERVSRHISDILAYLRHENALLPNAIVVAFDESVCFAPIPGAMRNEWGTFGVLDIPLPSNGQAKAGFIVDGQQRVAALAELDASRDFPVVVVAFCSASPSIQREQFVLVNKTKPLPKDLLNELLPHVDSFLPKGMRIRQISASILEILRFDRNSPFCGRIKGLGATGEGCNISQAAIISLIEKSMKQGGVLSEFAGNSQEETDLAGAAKVVSVFFSGVRSVWPTAWDGSPRNSRLVHGAGIFALGVLMDEIMAEVSCDSPRAISAVKNRLSKIKNRCAWMSGRWSGLRCEWNEIQNTSQDKRRLSEFLRKEYSKPKKA